MKLFGCSENASTKTNTTVLKKILPLLILIKKIRSKKKRFKNLANSTFKSHFVKVVFSYIKIKKFGFFLCTHILPNCALIHCRILVTGRITRGVPPNIRIGHFRAFFFWTGFFLSVFFYDGGKKREQVNVNKSVLDVCF